MLESGVTFDYGQLVMDNEYAEMIKYALKGIPVNDETLALDVVNTVGPFSQYRDQQHTFNHMREASHPTLIDRKVRQKWADAGGLSLYEKAKEKAKEILETHKPDPLPKEVLARMRSIVQETEEELGVGGK